jgi:glycosyltransferase involved in cell wall biosynthesis
MQKLPVSVCIISGAEAHRIAQVLRSVASWTSEIVVVLNEEVTDGTDKIAAEFGAKIYREKWKGFVGQKNSVTEKATQPWVLGLDADEVISDDLREEVQRLFAHPEQMTDFAAYNFPRCTICCGRWIRHGDWYPDRVTRLWRRGKAEWRGIEPHASLAVDGKIGKLSSDLLHFTQESIDRQISKIAPYSTAFVQHALEKNKTPRFFDLAVRPWWRFLRSYIFRLGFLDGWQGYYIAWFNAFSTLARYAKVREAYFLKEEKPRMDTNKHE